LHDRRVWLVYNAEPVDAALWRPVQIDAGGDLTGGTAIFNPTTHMVIAYDEPSGGGLVVGSGSQNILWCNSSVSEAANAAMLEFLQRVIDL